MKSNKANAENLQGKIEMDRGSACHNFSYGVFYKKTYRDIS
jgi:hypothetical protein